MAKCGQSPLWNIIRKGLINKLKSQENIKLLYDPPVFLDEITFFVNKLIRRNGGMVIIPKFLSDLSVIIRAEITAVICKIN